MLYGIGCDLCEIARLEKSLCGGHGAAFARRVFGPAEQKALGLCGGEFVLGAHTLASAAADFAAKEAFLKAAGTGLAGAFAMREIEAVRLESGAPAYLFTGKTAEWVRQNRITAHLSLSHDGGLAMAFCILEQGDKADEL